MAIGLDHHWLEQERDQYDCILINSRISSRDYISGTLRINRDNIMPFLKTYINAFSSSPDTQKAFVKVLLGEKAAVGKNPVSLK